MMLDLHENSATSDLAEVTNDLVDMARLDSLLFDELTNRLIALERRVAILEAEAQRKERPCR